MADYFSEYSSFIGAKGLPSPADTPYETPGFIRSKRSSRATAGSSREHSASPPPLPPDNIDFQEKSRDGRYTALDPRRFTPTLHASLVSEILNLRRELDSKNSLVENLESSLSTTRNENESLGEQLAQNAREVRKAKTQVLQMEQGTYDAVTDLAQERDTALRSLDELRGKLDAAQKVARRQDEDAERTQRIWESEKESWDDERRQLERRVHVTESRLKTVVDEMSARQAAVEASQTSRLDDADESLFKDSGLGNESDTASIRSAGTTATPTKKHRRNMSSLSFHRTRSLRNSVPVRNTGTPEPQGHNLADELGIDEEDEYDLDEFDHQDEELDFPERVRRTMESRQSSVTGELDSKAKRILGLTNETVEPVHPSPPGSKDSLPKPALHASEPSKPLFDLSESSLEQSATVPIVQPAHVVKYVDSGYQPSPPPSPPPSQRMSNSSVPSIKEPTLHDDETSSLPLASSATALVISPISPPDTPTVDENAWLSHRRSSLPRPSYATSATQTDTVVEETQQPKNVPSKRDSLSPPMFVPAIAIHPPTSRPSSPRAYVLPPGTKNASTQASLPWKSCDMGVQTEEIRVDRRPIKLPPHLLPSALHTAVGSETSKSLQSKRSGTNRIVSRPIIAPLLPSPTLHSSPQEESAPAPSPVPRNDSQKDLRSMPLRAIPLPRPILAPATRSEPQMDGPLNRSFQYGVTRPNQSGSAFLDTDKDSDLSDYDEPNSDLDTKDLEGSIPALSRPPHGRFGLSEPPKAVPEDKEISPERRPGTAESYGAAPAPSVASSRAPSRGPSQHAPPRATAPTTKLNAYKDMLRSRSPSFGSMASSSASNPPAVPPPYPIPTRSSSRIIGNSHSEGSQSPSPYTADVFGHRAGSRASRTQQSHHQQQNSRSSRQGSLRKVQSAAVIRNHHVGKRSSPRTSPRRTSRRRNNNRHSPDLTPVQSMAFDSPVAGVSTKFPIPDLPTPLQDSLGFEHLKGSMDMGSSKAAPTEVSSRRVSEETDLVDAIAATMVGEWMWKYIRKRKSFGVSEDFPVAEDGSVNTATHGSRHKRWVWLSPYERTIMWDSKQPTSGTALLGKKGRKLAIQSVLDVPDDTPVPKGAELSTAFRRSILILTPARALKFTTTTAERHTLWMTALSFLAQSGQHLPSQIPQMAAPPPPPTRRAPRAPLPALPYENPPSKQRHRSPSFGRSTVRDSIRIAKGKQRPVLPAHLLDSRAPPASTTPDDAATVSDSADFPAIPRLYSSTTRHQRKRSNTSPRLSRPIAPSAAPPPPRSTNAFRSFSSTAIATSSHNFSRHAFPSRTSSRAAAHHDNISDQHPPNFFEAVGTVRMEAFVDPNVRNGVLYVPSAPGAPFPPRVSSSFSAASGTVSASASVSAGTSAPAPAPALPRVGVRRGRGDSSLSQSTVDKRRAGYVFDEWGQDPFRNF